MDQYLKDKIIQETVRGGPAYYRPSHQASDPYARYKADAREIEDRVQRRVICLRLRWVFAIIRLPAWFPIGTILE